MTIRSVGYDGAIAEAEWSQLLAPYLGADDVVARSGDFRVTATTGMSVQVATGTAHSFGVTDVSDAAENIQIAAPTNGTRYDCIVLRRDWSGQSVTPSGAPTGGRTAVAVVQGGSAQTVPTLRRSGGTITEQPLALVKATAGTATVQVVDDLRAVHARTAYVRSLLAMTGPPGTRYVLEPSLKRYVTKADASGVVTAVEEWEPDPVVVPPIPKVASGTRRVETNQYGSCVIPHGQSWTPVTAVASPKLGTDSALVVCYVSNAAAALNATNLNITCKYVTATGQTPFVGTLFIDWMAFG